MRRLVLYMVTSVDGFIARPDGSAGLGSVDAEFQRFANDCFRSADGIVFGRAIYEGFVSFWDGLDPTDPSVTKEDVEFAEVFRG